MKKILFGIICLFLSITLVEAKEYCEVVSGNGKDIGSEIACGTEHFYVIDNDGTNTKMLAKYNLYVGANFNKIVLDINSTYYTTCTDCYGSFHKYYFEGNEVEDENAWESLIKRKYDLDYIGPLHWDDTYGLKKATDTFIYSDDYKENNNNYYNRTYKLYPYTIISENTKGYALQNELALGVTGEKGNANYPIYATTNLFDNFYVADSINVDDVDVFLKGYINFDFLDNTRIKKYLDDYYHNLNNNGYETLNVDMINMKELNELAYKISNKKLPLSSWWTNIYDETSYIEGEDYNGYYNLGDLKEYISDDYSWLWNTTYWTKTISNAFLETNSENNPVYFVTSTGEICSSESSYCVGIPRAGIRPVVTISNENISYIIETKTDGNGTVTAEKVTASGGETIKFTVTPNKGYVLSEVKVTDADGNVVTFTDYTFTMPNANVLIEATFVPANPNTKVFLTIIPIIVFIVSAIVYIKAKTKVYSIQ